MGTSKYSNTERLTILKIIKGFPKKVSYVYLFYFNSFISISFVTFWGYISASGNFYFHAFLCIQLPVFRGKKWSKYQLLIRPSTYAYLVLVEVTGLCLCSLNKQENIFILTPLQEWIMILQENWHLTCIPIWCQRCQLKIDIVCNPDKSQLLNKQTGMTAVSISFVMPKLPPGKDTTITKLIHMTSKFLYKLKIQWTCFCEFWLSQNLSGHRNSNMEMQPWQFENEEIT